MLCIFGNAIAGSVLLTYLLGKTRITRAPRVFAVVCHTLVGLHTDVREVAVDAVKVCVVVTTVASAASVLLVVTTVPLLLPFYYHSYFHE